MTRVSEPWDVVSASSLRSLRAGPELKQPDSRAHTLNYCLFGNDYNDSTILILSITIIISISIINLLYKLPRGPKVYEAPQWWDLKRREFDKVRLSGVRASGKKSRRKLVSGRVLCNIMEKLNGGLKLGTWKNISYCMGEGRRGEGKQPKEK